MGVGMIHMSALGTVLMELVFKMKNKKGVGKWFWIVIAVIVIAIGAYFLLPGGVGIPQPPALPA